MHDSLDFLSCDDERRQLASLISSFIRRASYGSDFDAHLTFYVECRGIFPSLDAVQDTLVLGVGSLAMRARSAARGRHSNKTAAFVKACAAYMYISTPTIDAPLVRIRLYLLGAQVALANGLLTQSEACFKAAVTVVPEALSCDVGPDGAEKEPEGNAAVRGTLSREENLVSLLASACSFLVSVPGHPKHGAFFLALGYLNVIQSARWRMPSSRLSLYARILSLFSAYGQRALPYSIPHVDSNDTLYAAEPEYENKLIEVCSLVLQQIDAEVASLAETAAGDDKALATPARKALVSACTSLFEVVLASADLQPPMVSLAHKLFGLAHKMSQTQAEGTQLRGAATHLARLAGKSGSQGFPELNVRVQAALTDAAAGKQ